MTKTEWSEAFGLARFLRSRREPGWRESAPPANQSVHPSAGAPMARRRTQCAALLSGLAVALTACGTG
ncbi:MAG: hypothetical protein J4F98_14800, partial [Acidobacteria bacterium]|nr:hypothetical protein [Acidobacteriota bacterium]